VSDCRRTLAGTVAAAVNLRITIIAVGPLIETIRVDVGMSNFLAGGLTTLPFVCVGVLSFGGSRLIQRYGYRRVVAVSLALLAAGAVVRALMPTAGLILLLTLPVGVAVAALTVVLPPAVKQWFPERAGAATGAYLAASGVGAGIASFLALPLSDALGGWRWALAAAALPALAALPLWLRAAPVERVVPGAAGESVPPRTPLRTRIMLAAIFTAQSVCVVGSVAWMAVRYTEAGWSPEAAGVATGVVAVLGVPTAIVVPALSDRSHRARWTAAAAAVVSVAVAGMAFSPAAPAWLWLVAFGLGNGALFPLVLALGLDAAGDPREASDLVTWTLGAGSLVAAFAPMAVGAMRDASGGLTLPFAVMAALAALSAVLAAAHRRERRPLAATA
jgi:CP family cyanate transporter-like MFS transporter